MSCVRILLVDDHQVVRLGVRALLEAEPDMAVIGEAGTAAEALRQVECLHPDITLMDIRLPDSSGVAACAQIRRLWPAVQVLMLTSYADEELVVEAIAAGAAGYVLKQVGTDDLARAIRAVAQGDAVLDPSTTRQLLGRIRRAELDSHSAAFRDLSERELDVLVLVATGKTNAEIASVLILSEKTVRNHVSTILEKLAVTNRIEAATYAVRHHIERART
jgi:two-component system, NarL family, response regulator DevR